MMDAFEIKGSFYFQLIKPEGLQENLIEIKLLRVKY